MTLLRHEDPRLITGSGRFSADIDYPAQLHAAMIRSDRAHANIVAIDLSAVRAAPGVMAVLTAEDVTAAGFQGIPTGAPLKGRDGLPQKTAAMPVLAGDKVCFVGQPIAMVIADTREAALAAGELATIGYDELPPVVGVERASDPNAPRIHPHVEGNLSLDFEAGDETAVETALAAATHRTTLRVESQRLVGNPMEPRASVAWHDAARGVTRIHTPNQGLHGMRNALAAITGWPATTIEVLAQDIGGSFGVRSNPYPETVLLMLAARRLGRAVKWVGARSELFLADWHGRALALTGTIGLDAEGRMLAVRFEDEVDLGAYSCYWGSFIGARNLSVTMGGVYRVPALHMRSRAYLSTTVPVSAYRGAGRPDIAFAIERLVEQAAVEHGFDPIELRRRNLVPVEAFPYRTANGTVYDCGQFEAILDRAVALIDRGGFAVRRAESASRGRLRGLGFASYLEASGGGGSKDEVSVEFAADGRMMLYAMSGPSGQGHETSFTRIVADALGIDASRIGYRASDPTRTLAGNNTGGSRTLYGVGSAFKWLARTIVDRGRVHAGIALGAAPGEVRYDSGAYRAGDAAITLEALAGRLGDQRPHPLNCEAESTSGTTFPNGCHAAEVEIDPDTGVIEVLDYVAVDDLGHVVSPELVRGQVHGGVVQGAGQVFGEHAIYDPDSGQLLTGSFSDYPMPRAGCVPVIRHALHPVPTALNALGAKGVGEAGCSGSLPALSNAVMDALRTAGVSHLDMPYTPARVWAALRAGTDGDPRREA